MFKKVEIFTDGACRGNPGPGGWGAVLRHGTHERSIYGAVDHTTNNRMELQAAISSLAELKTPCEVALFTDSTYVQKGVTEWMTQWKQRGWKTARKRMVKNSDLWKLLDEEVAKHKVQWHWVKGHSGHRENDMADALANQAIDEFLAK